MDVRALLSARAVNLGSQGASVAVFYSNANTTSEVIDGIRMNARGEGYAVCPHKIEEFGRWAAEMRLGHDGRATAVLIFTSLSEEMQPDAASVEWFKFMRQRKSKDDAGPDLTGLKFTVLGIGDSNLLASSYRNVAWATAKDCNPVAQDADAWLEKQGGVRFHCRGEADERSGSQELVPWVRGMVRSLAGADAPSDTPDDVLPARKKAPTKAPDDALPARKSSVSGGGVATMASTTAATALGFSPAVAFEGVMPGAVFKMGELGLGYYSDGPQTMATATTTTTTITTTTSTTASASTTATAVTSAGLGVGTVALAVVALGSLAMMTHVVRKGRGR